MPEAFLNPHPLLLSLFILFAFSCLVQLLYFWLLFFRLTLKPKEKNDPGSSPEGSGSPLHSDIQHPVSVVICAHNEYQNVEANLPRILEQDYPEFEVIVVNHASDDDTAFLLDDLVSRYPHLKVINLNRDLNFFKGKKFPLSIGIKSAHHDLVLLTDADCHPAGPNWIRLMTEGLREEKEIILGYGSYEKRRGILNALIRFDTLQVAVQYLSYACSGIPYMGVGRNLAYRKSLFFREGGFISHYRISSGDDDLFINRVATKRNTGVVTDPGSFTVSRAKRSLNLWILQKKRHFTTGRFYWFRHKALLGIYAATQWLFWLSLIPLLALKFAWIFVAGILFIRLLSQYIVFGRNMLRLEERDLIPWILPLEWLILIFNTGTALSNLLFKPGGWR